MAHMMTCDSDWLTVVDSMDDRTWPRSCQEFDLSVNTWKGKILKYWLIWPCHDRKILKYWCTGRQFGSWMVTVPNLRQERDFFSIYLFTLHAFPDHMTVWIVSMCSWDHSDTLLFLSIFWTLTFFHSLWVAKTQKRKTKKKINTNHGKSYVPMKMMVLILLYLHQTSICGPNCLTCWGTLRSRPAFLEGVWTQKKKQKRYVLNWIVWIENTKKPKKKKKKISADTRFEPARFQAQRSWAQGHTTMPRHVMGIDYTLFSRNI
jgi:hypothetical protein